MGHVEENVQLMRVIAFRALRDEPRQCPTALDAIDWVICRARISGRCLAAILECQCSAARGRPDREQRMEMVVAEDSLSPSSTFVTQRGEAETASATGD